MIETTTDHASRGVDSFHPTGSLTASTETA